MENIFNIKNRKQRNVDNSQYPKVVYQNRKMKNNISKWLKFLGCSSFGIVLRDIGFKPEDTVYLYDLDDGCGLNFCYSVNDEISDSNNKICLWFGNIFEFPPCIIVSNVTNKMTYRCIKTNPEASGIWFDMCSCQKKISPNVSYSREYHLWGSYFVVINGSNKLSFSVSDINASINENLHRLNNEEELEKYLTSLTFPVQIDQVYKKICEITSLNLSEYNSFCLEVCKLENSGTKIVSTDVILLENGNLKKFGMTVNNKTVFLDNNGNWSYKILGNETIPVDFSITSENENVSCLFNVNENCTLDEYTDTFFQYDINAAREEVENMKKRSRVMFNSNVTQK